MLIALNKLTRFTGFFLDYQNSLIQNQLDGYIV